MYNETVTIFNKYKSNTGDIWYPTVVKNVDLIVDQASIIAQYGEKNENGARLHIKIANGCVGGKPYLDPKEWLSQVNDDLGKYITFQSATDFFVKGLWTELPIDDNDYKDGFFQYVKKHHDNVFTITSVGRYTLIPHFEILGK